MSKRRTALPFLQRNKRQKIRRLDKGGDLGQLDGETAFAINEVASNERLGFFDLKLSDRIYHRPRKRNQSSIKKYGAVFLVRNLSFVKRMRKDLKRKKCVSISSCNMHVSEIDDDGFDITRDFSLNSLCCPLCNRFNGMTLEEIWLHSNISHGDVYAFSVVKEDDKFHIAAKQMDVIQKLSACLPKKNQSEVIVSRSRAQTAPKTKDLPLLDEVVKTDITAPARKYYHFSSFQPIRKNEFILGTDCDTKIDNAWQQRLADNALADFTDVSSQEMEFCTMWNRFIDENPVNEEADVPLRCLHFIETNANYFFEHDLTEQVMHFLISRYDEGCINRDQMEVITNIYYHQSSTPNELDDASFAV